MTKRIISFTLVVLFVFLCFPIGASAKDDKYNECFVNVVWNGTSIPKTVLQKGGELYAPISWLTYFGLLKCKEENNKFVFYYADQEGGGDFAKRIFIDKAGTTFSICFCMSKNSFVEEFSAYYKWFEDSIDALKKLNLEAVEKEDAINNVASKLKEAWDIKEDALAYYNSDEYDAVPIIEGKFSSNINYENELYLPVAEILPFINAKIAVVENYIYINSNFVSLSQALNNADIGSLIFDADDDIKYKEVVSVGGYIVDSLADFRFDRWDFITNSGRINDYEEIFKAYLTEDETYLSAYDKENTPGGEAFAFGKDMFSFGETAYDLYDGITDFEEYYNAMTEIDPEIYELLGDGVDLGIEATDILEGAGRVVSYWDSYVNQIEDHRKMLGAVYEYDLADKRNNTPSYQAAVTVQKRYGEDTVDLLLSNAKDGLEDCLLKAFEKGAEGIIPTPYMYALKLTKLAVPEAFETMHNDSLIYVMDGAVQKSYDTYLKRKYSGEYDSESLNELRLCSVMALIASKHAYKTVWDEDYGKIAEIDECLKKLYLAADGVECDSSDYYEKKCKELKASFKSWKPLNEKELEELTPEKTEVKVLLSGIEAEEIQYAETDLNYNFCFIKRNGKWGAIDYEGNILIPTEYDYYSITEYQGSNTCVTINKYEGVRDTVDGQQGEWYIYVNADGSLNKVFEPIILFSGGIVLMCWDVNENKPYMYVRSGGGDRLMPYNKSEYDSYDTGHSVFYNQEYISDDFPAVLPAYAIINGSSKSSNDEWQLGFDLDYYTEKIGIFDVRTERMLTDFIFDEYDGDFCNGILAVKQEDKWGYVNDKGEMITDFVYDPSSEEGSVYLLYNFHPALNGYIVVKKDGMYGLINTSGETVVEPVYKNFSNVNPEGLCWVQVQDGTWSVIDVSE